MVCTRYSSFFIDCGLIIIFINKAFAIETTKLSSGYNMPVIGLGTWQIQPEDVDRAITAALNNGYKHIDTAFVYNNEDAIGKSLKKYFDNGGKREDLFITTKLPAYGLEASEVEKFLKLSLERLNLQYVDMYLVHTPMGIKAKEDKGIYTILYNEDGSVVNEETDHLLTWKAMESQVKAGRARSIGLSNFNESQILNIINNSVIKPSNLQIELQAYNQQKPLREFCKKHNIAVTSYSTLGSPGSVHIYQSSTKNSTTQSFIKLLENSVVKNLAQNHKKSPAQILLRHLVQNGIIVIPKSSNPERIKENINIFDFKLNDEEMKQMNDLDKGENGRIFDFLFFKGIDKHPQYPWSAALRQKS